ncbi:MAG: hypothetical protein ACRD3W_09685, partial [Terriglobales bacterium]
PSVCFALLRKTTWLLGTFFSSGFPWIAAKARRPGPPCISGILSQRLGVDEIALDGRLTRPKDGAAEPKLAPTVTHGQANKLLIQDRIYSLGKLSGVDQQKEPQPEHVREGWRPQEQSESSRSYSAIWTLGGAALATGGRLRHVLVPVLGFLGVILVTTAVIRTIIPATPAAALVPVPEAPGSEPVTLTLPGLTVGPGRIRKASPSTDAPPGFTILVATAPREPLPPVAENIAGMIGMANPLPSPSSAPGFSILVDVSLPAPLPPFAKSVASLIAITSPLTELPNQLRAATPAPKTSMVKPKPKPKAKLAAPGPKEANWWTRLPWLATP